ncbi:MAG: HAMP domain-containing sensor histidine kinase, partial [Bacteroidales bacterium]|nr:HAMP domain-containing sensor histidine kinase [Bacteroidales bacterium]
SLMNEDSDAVGGLIGQKSEFGRIAQLISEFFAQKTKLVEEIEERKKIHEELIEAKERAEESDRLKTSFLNNISHEIRTPMNAINGFSELLAEPILSDEEKLDFSKIIYDSSNRLLEVITDLINISTIESGQMEICKELVNLNSLLRSVLEQISNELDFKKVKIKLDVALEDEQSGIRSDPSKLFQILTHLLKNSAKFTPSGNIEFGYEIRHGEIEFFICDTGIGIPTEKFETIFARFQQVDDSTSRQFGGAGLGLPISKAYVELLGGKIWLKSKEGEGTQFYFTIPYIPA